MIGAAVGIGLLAILPAAAVAVRLRTSSASRRWLAVALSLAVPVAGPVLALIAVRVRGTGQIEVDLDVQADERPRNEPAPEDASSAAALPSLLDRLMSSDPKERLAALVTVSHTADKESIALLRWTIEHGEPAAVLDAALTLEELELKWERRLEEASAAAREAPSADRALFAAQLAVDGITSGLVDPAIIPSLADEARDHLRVTRSLVGTEDRTEVDVCQARLELATGQPELALSVLDAAVDRAGTSDPEIDQLRARARFAARRPGSRQVGFTVFLASDGSP